MIVEFIGHAGFLLKAKNIQILVDPWFTSSTLGQPILSSINDRHLTIDYAIPEVVLQKESVSPEVILISHFHAHHSLLNDLIFFKEKSCKKITIVYPDCFLNETACKNLDGFEQKKIKYDAHIYYENIHIYVFQHTVVGHLGFLVEDGESNTSFMHIADAQANRLDYDRRLDVAWFKLRNIKPTMLVLSGGATTSVLYKNEATKALSFEKPTHNNYEWTKILRENSFMSPVENAKLVDVIKPHLACLMGMYNFSVWKQRKEFSFSASENENYFHWAMFQVNPQIKTFALRPGNKVDLECLAAGLPYIKL